MRQLRNKRAIVTVLSILCLPVMLAAQKTLEQNSPFLPPGYQENKPAEPEAPQAPPGMIAREIEFRGIVKFGNEYQFSLFDKRAQKGYWIKMNETQGGMSVRSYNPSEMSIAVSRDGRTERVSLLQATENPLPVPVAQVQPQAQPQQLPGAAQPTPAVRPAEQNQPNNVRTVPRRRVILPQR